MKTLSKVALILSPLLWATPALAQDAPVGPPAPSEGSNDLAKQLSNPISSLISVPFQFNYDSNVGPEKDGERLTLNVQPVIPFKLSDKWNLVSRTIVPIVWQDDISPGSGSQSGLGDTVQSFFFTPTKASGIVWGVGPVFLVPTGTSDLLSGRKWGAGPTVVALKQSNGWTIGGLANHIWSVAGSDNRSDISISYANPFVSYTTKKATTFTLSADYTYDWEAKDAVMPLNMLVSQLVKVGKQPISVGGGLRYYALTSPASPHGLAARFSLTLLFPAS